MKWGQKVSGSYAHVSAELHQAAKDRHIPGYVVKAIEDALQGYACNEPIELEVGGAVNLSGHGSLILKLRVGA